MENGSFDGNGTSDTMVRLPSGAIIGYNAYLSCTIAFGVPGNLLVLLVYMKYGPATSTDWFIIFITLYDFISSLISVPIYLTFTSGAWKHYGNDVICKLHMFLSQTLVLSSTFLVCGLAIERYCKICRPHVTNLTRKKSKIICVMTSVVSALLSTPCFAFFHNSYGHCGTTTQGLLANLLMAYYTAMLLSFVIAIIIMIFTYSKIVAAIIVSDINMRKHLQQNRKQKFTTQSFFALLICCKTNRIYPNSNLSSNMEYTETKISLKKEVQRKSGHSLNIRQLLDPNIAENTKEMCKNEVHFHKNSKSQINGSGETLALELSNQNRSNANTLGNATNFKKNATMHGLEATIPEFQRVRSRSAQDTDVSTNFSSAVDAHQNRTGTSVSIRNRSTSSVLMSIRSINEHRRVRRSLKTTRVAFFICLVFVLSWLPPWISFLNFVFTSTTTKQTPTYLAVTLFCKMTYLINTFTNPVLYTALNKTFRDRLRHLAA